MNWFRIAEIIGLVIMAVFGSAGFWQWMTSRKQKREIYDQAHRAGVEAASVLDKRAVGLLDPYVKQVAYLSSQLDAAQAESQAAREESRLARAESRSLRVRIDQLENILISHGLALEGGAV